MKKNKLFIAILLFTIHCSLFTASAQSWQELMDSTKYYQESFDYHNALKWGFKALNKGEREFGENHKNVAATLSVISSVYNISGKIDSALFYQEKCVESGRIVFKNDDSTLASWLIDLANYEQAIEQNDIAEKHLNEALSMLNRLYKSDNYLLAKCLYNLGGLYSNTARFKESDSIIRTALSMFRRIVKGDDIELAKCINSLAYNCDQMYRLIEAEKLFRESYEMQRRLFIGDNPELANIMNNMAYILDKTGKYSESEPFFKESLKMKRRLYKGDHEHLAISLHNMAYFLYRRGKYAESEKLEKEALEMYRRIYKGDHPQIIYCLMSLANSYNSFGRWSEGEKLSKEALEMGRRLFKNDHPLLLIILDISVETETSNKNLEKADSLIHESIEMSKRLFGDESINYANNLAGLAIFYSNEKKDYVKAGEILNKSLEILRKNINYLDRGLANIIYGNAMINWELKNYQKADSFFSESIEMQRKIFNYIQPDIARFIFNAATYYKERGQPSLAENMYSEALQIFLNAIQSNFPTFSEKEKEQFWMTMREYFSSFNSFAIERMKDNPKILCNMYDNQLLTKALLFSSTSKVKRRILNSGDSVLIRKYESWVSLKEYLIKLYTYPEDYLAYENIKLDSLVNASNEIEKELSSKSELFSDSYEKKIINWKTIQTFLKPDEAAVEIIKFSIYHDKGIDTTIYAVLIVNNETSEHPDIVILDNGKELDSSLYITYRRNLKLKEPDNVSFNNYWAKIYSKLKGYKKIYLSTDGIFNKLNPSTFITPSGKYLVEEQDIQICNSTRDIVESVYKSQNESNLDNRAELFGNPNFILSSQNPMDKKGKNIQRSVDEREFIRIDSLHTYSFQSLPGTQEEIQNIEKFLKSKNWVVNKHLKENATKSSLRIVNNPRILHIATHGIFLSDIENQKTSLFGFGSDKVADNPLLRSGLIFTGVIDYLKSPDKENYSNDNGILTAYEAMDLDLDHTELVVLSACETGLGEVKNGEGVYGLQRAFQTAGAKTVMMSLWNVGDESTNLLMSKFYKNWVSGMTKHEAFRQSQLELMKKYPEPYYWGAFVMVGE